MEIRGRSWGREEVFERNAHFDFKRIIIAALQSWRISEESPRLRTFVCLSGIAKVIYQVNGQDNERYLKSGDMVTLGPENIKSVIAIDGEVILIEASSLPVVENKTRKWF